jgi:hypothetical protein
MNTRKHPRTMQQAFGPYTSNTLHEPDRPLDWQDYLVTVCCVITILICAALVLVGWIV